MAQRENFDKELSRVLRERAGFEPDKAAGLRKEAVKMFDKKLKKAKLLTWGMLIFCLLVILHAVWQLNIVTGVKSMFWSVIVLLVAYEGAQFIKLWYWVVNTKISVLKEVKQLQLQIAEMAGKNPSQQ